ncbi:MAG TPA: hypothetical protein VNW94_08565 [Streptosporangiaceae bacterium]|nr:hypothetical protein [Streptosporangiaceae bacterium]
MIVGEAAAVEIATERPGRRPVAWVSGLVVLGVALFWLPLTGVHLDAMNGYGLIGVLPAATLLGAALLVVAFLITLGFARPHRRLLTVQVVVLLFSLHYVAQSLEAYARFPTAWQHAGLIEYIARNRTTSWDLDARFTTPGFFAFIAFGMKAVGQHDIEPLLRYAPVLTELMYLIPFMLILRTLRATWRAKWFAAWLFVVANWVGQDYLSPQAFAYLLYMYFVAILVNWFRNPIETTRRPGRRAAQGTGSGFFWRVYDVVFGPKDPGELPAPSVPLGERRILLVLVVLLVAAGTAAHQLTPFLMTAASFGLVVARRCNLRSLPVLCGLLYAAWVSFMTVGYWASRKGELFGGLGRVWQNFNQSVGDRISQTSAATAQVQQLRILLALAVMGLAFLGLLRRRYRGIDDRVALVLVLVPFSSLGLQNYGGELALRIYFFMVPAACVLIAYLFFPAAFDAPSVRTPSVRLRFGWLRGGPRRHWPGVLAATPFALLMTFGFLTVRYGNEAFEQVHPSDVRAFDVMLRQTPPDRAANILWLSADNADLVGGTPVMPWAYRDWERTNVSGWVLADRNNPADISLIITRLREQGPTGFFVTTRSHEEYQHLSSGLSPDYGTRMRAALAASPELRVVFADRDAAVYALRAPPAEPVTAAPKPSGLGLRSSPWTPAGLVYLPVLLGLLMTRELRRLQLSPADYRRLRPLTVLTIPLFLGVMAVIVERFVVIS